METYKKGLEEFVTEIIFGIIMGPKTAIRILQKPDWIAQSVVAEASKSKESRYEDTTSPMLYWLVFSVFPLLISLDAMLRIAIHFVYGTVSLFEQARADEHFEPSLSAFFEHSSTAVEHAVFASVLIPLAFALSTLVVGRRTFVRSELERAFFSQCYLCGTAFLCLSVPFLAFAALRSVLPHSVLVFFVLLIIYYNAVLATIVWFLRAQSRTIELLFHLRTRIRIASICISLAVAFGVFCLLARS